MSSLSERLYAITKRHPTLNNKGKLAEYLGCSRSMLYNYENNNPEPPKDFLDKLLKLEVVIGIAGSEKSSFVQNTKNIQSWTFPRNSSREEFPQSSTLREESPPCGGIRRIQVIGWAHAGQAGSYEEIPAEWQRTVPKDCRDSRAFGVTLEGDSMEPMFRDGDLLVLMPSERIYNGCIAVIRLASDGVLLRRLEVRGERLRLVPLNVSYEAEDLTSDQISWAYPVWGSWRQVAK